MATFYIKNPRKDLENLIFLDAVQGIIIANDVMMTESISKKVISVDATAKASTEFEFAEVQNAQF